MRWVFIVLLMCNGIFFLWQNYLEKAEVPLESVAGAPAPADAPRLVLLRESLDSATPVDDRRVVVEKVEAAPEPSNICWQIGPFKEEVSGKQVVSRLAALDIRLKLQSLEIADKPDYWVLIPPRTSRREALKLLKELQIKKIDSFLITEGELENGISLGFFTQRDRAENIFNKRREQGYPAEMREVPRAHTELWAIFDEGEYGKFSDALWQKITEGNQGLERRKNYCDKIASAGNFD